ncbi:Por secretion system C-terminal sorting domain-containing protein [Formosa sp. Hel1_31_208]|uniref:T9SS type A sorting domain-containing protein n=1 Tax=Formosa sp. Hel1_31_208 TaxID=1798225 RepID=UPI00087A1D2F|nr:T9SS type A sorting domain-containing protein [Formosa sp. Hel1_31_208]SDS31146.1 Por secretion system C-terminal sorting domain-containing protein [Formosa sp. Hel1_31_208]
MKQIYVLKSMFTFLILSSMLSQAQTYNLDTSGFNTCPNPGIDATFNCSFDGDPAMDFGTFMDTNTAGMELSTMSLVIYDACDGDFEIFLNGVSVITGNSTGTGCSCEAISANANITINLTVTITPAIIAAYVIGGNNTLSVTTSNSAAGAQCFYGADVTVTTSALGVEEFDFDAITVYPNPTKDFIMISGLIQTTNYTIYNVLGSVVNAGSISNNENIDIRNFSNGLYFLKLANTQTVKFIKE